MSHINNNCLAQVLLCEHIKWDCKYHVVFSPKFRRKEIYGELRREIGQMLCSLCERKGVEIIEANTYIDHIHVLVCIQGYYVSTIGLNKEKITNYNSRATNGGYASG